MSTNPERRGMHDMGGDPDHRWSGPVPRAEHVLAPWEKEVDAIRTLLGRKGLQTADELRLGIESLSGEDYARLSYYERWLRSVVHTMEVKGILKPGAHAAKVAELKARRP
ncbi:SH3-like domain-containing protein [Elioraea rosea]|uniref:SH3-like domain-containing protein n=1 Tax=Elioraea rosea TaxID=2492390 RepID=UPI00118306A7